MCKYQNAAALYPRCKPGAGPSRNQRNREAAVTVNGGGLCFRQIDICTGDDAVGPACPIGTDGGVVVKLRLDFQQRRSCEEVQDGVECVCTCRSRWSTEQLK